MNGTVKIGRWTYPARKDDDGTVTRAEKRDGSGEWAETNPALFVPDEEPADTTSAGDHEQLAASRIQSGDVPAIDGFVEAEVPEAVTGHGGKVGAQTASPGKSTWQVGTPCPKGHTLSEETLYIMPSGRKQCKVCRGSYKSNGTAS